MTDCAADFLEQIDQLKQNALVPDNLRTGLGGVANFVKSLANDARNGDVDSLAKKLHQDGSYAVGADVKNAGEAMTQLFAKLGAADFKAADDVQGGADPKDALCPMFASKAADIQAFLAENP